MIKNILIGFLALFASFNFILCLFPNEKDVFYDNTERAEEFVYENQKYKIVTIGSSLIGGFDKTSLTAEESFFNLFFPFSGSCTGAEVIVKSNKFPEVLLVEINHIPRGRNLKLLEEIFNPYTTQLKNFIPSFLKKNQFLTYLIDSFKTPKNESLSTVQPPPKVYEKLLKNAQQEWSIMPDSIQLKNELKEFKKNLDKCKKNKSKIIFFEMPMDSSLTNSKRARFIRYKIKSLFPQDYHIPLDTSKNYKTGDGSHLLQGEVDYCSLYLKEKIVKIR